MAKANLGTLPSLTAGAALLIDYTLTVAVSVSAGVAAITSAVPSLHEWRVEICVIFVLLIILANLRGIRESGTIFAVPTYLFVFSILILIGIGIVRSLTGAEVALNAPRESVQAVEAVSIWLVLRAFTAGCTALTGVEAISDGVPAFKPPEARNAAKTLTWMCTILGVMFIGLSFLAHRYGIVPNEQETVVSADHTGAGGAELLLLLRAGDDRAHPRPRGEHEFRGLPTALDVAGAGSLHAEAVPLPR